MDILFGAELITDEFTVSILYTPDTGSNMQLLVHGKNMISV